MTQQPQESVNPAVLYTFPLKVLLLHLICGLGLASAFWVAHNFCAVTLIESPSETLRVVWGVDASIVILVYSLLRRSRDENSPLLFLVNLGMIGIKYLLTLLGSTDFIICVPAHGAVIGALFGAWPMPLDWGRPWQEWPICVTHGAISGYIVGMIVSFRFTIFHSRQSRVKSD